MNKKKSQAKDESMRNDTNKRSWAQGFKKPLFAVLVPAVVVSAAAVGSNSWLS